MTQLTTLDIRSVLKCGEWRVSADIFWLGHATNLRNLRALSIAIFDAALPLIGNLTGLTGLTVLHFLSRPYDALANSIAPLTRLTSLRSLNLKMDLTESNLAIACSLGSGSLVDLELRHCSASSADCGRLLARQTALKRLSLCGYQLCNLRHIGALRIDLLECLEITDRGMLDAEGVSVLCRAASLTKLCLVTQITQLQTGLSQALARLTQLRSLQLAFLQEDAKRFLDIPLAFSPLTGLTELSLSVHHLDDGDLRALLVLTGLRVLHLGNFQLTDDVLPELGILTNLRKLTFFFCGVRSLAPVSNVLDPLRTARGLPPLHADPQ